MRKIPRIKTADEDAQEVVDRYCELCLENSSKLCKNCRYKEVS